MYTYAHGSFQTAHLVLVLNLMNEITALIDVCAMICKKERSDIFFHVVRNVVHFFYATTRHRFNFFMGPSFMIALAWLCMLY